MKWVYLVGLLGLSEGAQRHNFESCGSSRYCGDVARRIGHWAWSAPELIDSTDASVTFVYDRRCAADPSKFCTDFECRTCSDSLTAVDPPAADSLLTSIPEPPSVDVVTDPEEDLIEAQPTEEDGVEWDAPDLPATPYKPIYTNPKVRITLSLVQSKHSDECVLRVRAFDSTSTSPQYEVGPDVFEANPCSAAHIERGDHAVVFKSNGNTVARLSELKASQGPSITIYQAGSESVLATLSDLTMTTDSYGFQVKYNKAITHHGLPEHTVSFDLPRQFTTHPQDEDEWYRFYNADIFEYEVDSPMAMYASIPFLVTTHAIANDTNMPLDDRMGLSGTLMLQPSELYVKLAGHDVREDSVVRFVGEYGVFDVAFFSTMPSLGLSGLTARMTEFTGRPEFLPPQAALGLHQCRWNYESQDDVLHVASMYKNYEIPLDYIWLDIDHSQDRRYFTWNSHFPDPEGMRLRLLEQQLNLVVIVDPHIKSDATYDVHNAFKPDLLVQEFGGPFKGWCWPGESVYPDVIGRTEDVTEIYADYYTSWPKLYRTAQSERASEVCAKWSRGPSYCDLLTQATVNVGMWNDMNEPSVFNKHQVTMPKGAQHHLGNGTMIDHGAVHNMYGIKFQQVSYDAFRQARTNERPFLLTRSAFVGSQKYGMIWTGDNTASTSHMYNSVPMMLSMGLAGYSLAGADIGGFFGEPTSDLMLRWVKLGKWYPFMRIHSTMGTTRREIYEWPNYAKIREQVLLRYRLLPFWQARIYEHMHTGVPLWTSVGDFEMRHNATSIELARDDAFLVGETFFVVPVGTARLPATKHRWYTYPDFHAVPEGQVVVSEGDYVKSGSVLVTKERARLTTEGQRYDPFTVTIVAPSRAETVCGDVVLDDYKTTAAGVIVPICAAFDGQSFMSVKIDGNAAASGVPTGTALAALRVVSERTWRCDDAPADLTKPTVLTCSAA